MTQDTTVSPFVDQTSMDNFRASLRCDQYVRSQGRSGTCGKPAISVKPRRDGLPQPLCKLHTTLARKDEARWSYRSDFNVRDITDDDLVALKIAHDEHVAREAAHLAARRADAAVRAAAAKTRAQQETLVAYGSIRADKHEPDWGALARNERATIVVPRWYVATLDVIAAADPASDYPINSWGAIDIESNPEYGEPRLYVRNAGTLTPAQARELARVLIEAADAIG